MMPGDLAWIAADTPLYPHGSGDADIVGPQGTVAALVISTHSDGFTLVLTCDSLKYVSEHNLMTSDQLVGRMIQ